MVVGLPKVVMYAAKADTLCRLPYPGHRGGCPNYEKKAGCPPGCSLFDERVDLGKPVFAVINEFNLADHVRRMREKHPKWSYRQLSCCLYWQGRARKHLKAKVAGFLEETPLYVADFCPEAGGVNVTETLRLAGIKLEWPPKNIVRQVTFVGVPRK